jgi:DNA-binding transcriptional LysR family regulator
VFERQFGTSLLERSPHGIELTPAGQLVADFARRTLLEYEALRADLDDLRGGGRATIRIGIVESAIGVPLTAMQRIQPDFPGVSFRLLTLPASQVEDAVRDGLCDLGLTLNAVPTPELRAVHEVAEPVVVAVEPSHRLASRASVRLGELTGEKLAVHESDHGVRQLFERACGEQGVVLKPVLSSSSLQVLREFARRGMGAALLTRSGGVELEARGRLVLVPIDDPSLLNGRLVLLTAGLHGPPESSATRSPASCRGSRCANGNATGASAHLLKVP